MSNLELPMKTHASASPPPCRRGFRRAVLAAALASLCIPCAGCFFSSIVKEPSFGTVALDVATAPVQAVAFVVGGTEELLDDAKHNRERRALARQLREDPTLLERSPEMFLPDRFTTRQAGEEALSDVLAEPDVRFTETGLREVVRHRAKLGGYEWSHPHVNGLFRRPEWTSAGLADCLPDMFRISRSSDEDIRVGWIRNPATPDECLAVWDRFGRAHFGENSYDNWYPEDECLAFEACRELRRRAVARAASRTPEEDAAARAEARRLHESGLTACAASAPDYPGAVTNLAGCLSSVLGGTNFAERTVGVCIVRIEAFSSADEARTALAETFCDEALPLPLLRRTPGDLRLGDVCWADAFGDRPRFLAFARNNVAVRVEADGPPDSWHWTSGLLDLAIRIDAALRNAAPPAVRPGDPPVVDTRNLLIIPKTEKDAFVQFCGQWRYDGLESARRSAEYHSTCHDLSYSDEFRKESARLARLAAAAIRYREAVRSELATNGVPAVSGLRIGRKDVFCKDLVLTNGAFRGILLPDPESARSLPPDRICSSPAQRLGLAIPFFLERGDDLPPIDESRRARILFDGAAYASVSQLGIYDAPLVRAMLAEAFRIDPSLRAEAADLGLIDLCGDVLACGNEEHSHAKSAESDSHAESAEDAEEQP